MWRLILKYLAAGAACPVASKVFIIKMTMSGCLCISLACAALSDSLYTVLGRGILYIVTTSFASLMGSRYRMILFLSCLLYPHSQTCRNPLMGKGLDTKLIIDHEMFRGPT